MRRVGPLLRPMGITRIANITGLDVFGIPVVNVIRPNARSLTASQGKGLDLAAAKASAVMEAIECHCAEHITRPLQQASIREMAARHRIPAPDALARPRHAAHDSDAPMLWIEGRQLDDNAATWLPFELVHCDYTIPDAPGAGRFLLSSNGLASGNAAEEAISHGLSEAIERDASALFRADPRLLQARRLDPASIEDATCQGILDRLRRPDFAFAIWDMTSDLGVAAFRCEIMERPGEGTALPQPASGEGCDPDRRVALIRAVTEAAQARLSMVAGVRDDLPPDMYGQVDDAETLAQWWQFLVEGRGRRRFDQVADHVCRSAREEIEFLLARLREVGLPPAIAVDLTPEGMDTISVMRVVVPGLEPPPESDCVPGARLRAAKTRAA